MSHLYNLARWRGPNGRRTKQLEREPLCRMCRKAGKLTEATTADHIIPHRGDEHLFWHGELQSLCKAHHDSTKQAEENRGFTAQADDDGWPIDPRHPSNRA